MRMGDQSVNGQHKLNIDTGHQDNFQILKCGNSTKKEKSFFLFTKIFHLTLRMNFLKERNIFYDPDPQCPGTDQCIWSLIMRPGAVLILSIVSIIH